VFSNFFLSFEIVLFMRQCGKNTVERGRPQVTVWRMRIACWIPKAKDTHSKYVTLTAILPQQWLHERASLLPQQTVLFLRYPRYRHCPFERSIIQYDVIPRTTDQTIQKSSRSANCKVCKTLMFKAVDNKPPSRPYPQSHESRPRLPRLFKIYFNIIILSTNSSSK